MNREQTTKAIEVMQAFVNGEAIQMRRLSCRPGTQDDKWVDMHTTSAWNWTIFDYRIKPEPIEIEVWWHPDHGCYHKTRDWAGNGWTKKKFREVIE